jgi:cyclic pyranopterin monophosphate synthase
LRDVSAKVKTLRTATAEAVLKLSKATLQMIHDGSVPKGDPLPVAKIAAIQAAKNTSQIIPYCHPLPIDFVSVEFEFLEREIRVKVLVKAIYKTGVEMEALTGASVAALTLYDMLKMLDEEMEVVGVRLVQKTGGKSDFKDKFLQPLKCGVLVLSDTVASGKKQDHSGKEIVERLEQKGLLIGDYQVIPDERDQIISQLQTWCDASFDLVITTGGTGLSPRDCTPEAMDAVLEKEAPGIMEAARAYGQERTPFSMLSRGRAGLRGQTLIVNLPGSRNGVVESLDAIFPAILHTFNMMRGGGHGPEAGKAQSKTSHPSH